VASSDKRVKNIKTGLELIKVVKQSNQNLSSLCSQISNDYILKNSEFLIDEKKLLKENTEQETHMKINDLIHNIKNTVKNTNIYQNNPSKKKIRSLSEAELNGVKNILDDKIKNEEIKINNKIQGYLDKLKNKAETDVKEFRNFADHMDMSDLKFINYSKPKPYKVKDRECPNIIKIKKKLSSFLENKQIKLDKRKSLNNKDILNQENKANISDEIINTNMTKREIKRNDSNKDSLIVLNKLANQNKKLYLKINKKINKFNSLVDINLPCPTSYEQIIQKYRNDSSKLRDNNEQNNNKNNLQENIKEILKECNLADPHLLSKNKLEKIINLFKKEIDILKKETFYLDKEDDKNNKYKIDNQLNVHLNKIKRYNQKKESNNNSSRRLNVSESSLLIKRYKKSINKDNKKKGEPNIFRTSRDNSFLISNNYYLKNNQVKLVKKNNNCSYSNDSNISVISKYVNNHNDESMNYGIDSYFNYL
jgi:hypothetical protein